MGEDSVAFALAQLIAQVAVVEAVRALFGFTAVTAGDLSSSLTMMVRATRQSLRFAACPTFCLP